MDHLLCEKTIKVSLTLLQPHTCLHMHAKPQSCQLRIGLYKVVVDTHE